MRCRLALIVLFVTSCLLVGKPVAYAQSNGPTASCPNSVTSGDQKPSGAEISIAEVTFSGSLLMPISEQEQIADSVKRNTHGTSLDGVTEEGLERVRGGWQDRGYFNVQVCGEATTLTSNPVSQRIAMRVQVDEGSQYKLRSIGFKNNKAISSVDVLRGFFPIADGDIFGREKIATGLENLRKAYGELGYINCTAIPDTKLDEENGLVSLKIDLDEGKQFYVSSIHVLGLDEPARKALLDTLPLKRGQIYNNRLWEISLLQFASMFPDCDCCHEPLHINEKSGVVTLTLDFRPCSAD